MKIKEKIKKLLSLATSSNENEARAALLKAKELMAKNKLDESDFEETGHAELATLICDDIKWTTDSGDIWMSALCNLICEEHLCIAAWRTPPRTRTHTLVITGMQEDAETCREVIRYAVGFVRGRIKILSRKYDGRRSTAQSYAEGFIMGLSLAYDEQKEEHPEWGLVVVKSDEVKKYEEDLSTKSVRVRKSSFNPLAHAQGQIDGREFTSKKALTA